MPIELSPYVISTIESTANKYGIRFARFDWAMQVTTAEEKADLIEKNRSQIIQSLVGKGVLSRLYSTMFHSAIHFFPLITTTATIDGINMLISKPGLGRISNDNLKLIAEKNGLGGSNRKSWRLGRNSDLDIGSLGLDSGFVGPFFDNTKSQVPTYIFSGYYLDESTHTDQATPIVEIALSRSSSLFLPTSSFDKLVGHFYLNNNIVSISYDEVEISTTQIKEI